jgi:predicted  nucleic acid-binding Zn-ribbon protein
LQCAQLKSDKSLLSSRLHAAEAAASDAAAELKHAREAAEAASEEIQMLKAEVQELRHQVSLAAAACGICHASHVTGLTTAALRIRKGASPAGYQSSGF